MNAAAREMDRLVDRFMADVIAEARLYTPGSGAGLSTRPGNLKTLFKIKTKTTKKQPKRIYSHRYDFATKYKKN